MSLRHSSFQLPHPAKGVTWHPGCRGDRYEYFNSRTHEKCDTFCRAAYFSRQDFNSHTPCGVRHLMSPWGGRPFYFNSRTRARCGLIAIIGGATGSGLQFSHSVRGTTLLWNEATMSRTGYFNSHTPCGVRPPPKSEDMGWFENISTPAPLWGAT